LIDYACLTFRSKGIAESPGYFPFGSSNSWKALTGKIAFSELVDEFYHPFKKDKIVGTYGPLGQQILVVCDIDIVKNILIKDFDHFVNRRQLLLNEKSNKYFVNMLTFMT